MFIFVDFFNAFQALWSICSSIVACIDGCVYVHADDSRMYTCICSRALKCICSKMLMQFAVRICVHVCFRACIHAYDLAHCGTYTHIFKHAYVHHIHTYIHTYIRMHMHTHVHACAHMSKCTDMTMLMQMALRVYVPSMYTCMCSCAWWYISSYIQTCICSSRFVVYTVVRVHMDT